MEARAEQWTQEVDANPVISEGQSAGREGNFQKYT